MGSTAPTSLMCFIFATTIYNPMIPIRLSHYKEVGGNVCACLYVDKDLVNPNVNSSDFTKVTLFRDPGLRVTLLASLSNEHANVRC